MKLLDENSHQSEAGKLSRLLKFEGQIFMNLNPKQPPLRGPNVRKFEAICAISKGKFPWRPRKQVQRGQVDARRRYEEHCGYID